MKQVALFIEGIKLFVNQLRKETDENYFEIKEFYGNTYIKIMDSLRKIIFVKLRGKFLELNKKSKKLDFSPNGVKKEKNAVELLECMDLIVDTLLQIADSSESSNFMESKTLKFISLTCTNWGHLPDDYLAQFEFNRLQFSSTGAVKNINSNRMQMMIGNFFIIKVLIKSILFYPEYNFNQAKMDVELSDNFIMMLKQIACYFYYIYILDIAEDDIDIIPDNTAEVIDKSRIPSVSNDTLVYGKLFSVIFN